MRGELKMLIVDTFDESFVSFSDGYEPEVQGKPISQHIIESAAKLGVTDVYIIENKMSFKARSTRDVSVTKLSPADAERLANDLRGYVVLVVYSSFYVDRDGLSVLVDSHLERGGQVTMLTSPCDATRSLYAISFDERNEVRRVCRAHERTGYAFIGCLVCEGKYLESLVRSRFDVERFTDELIRNNVSVSASIWYGEWCLMDSPWSLLVLSKILFSRRTSSMISPRSRVSPRAVIEGLVVIDDDAVVDHDAIIRGPVYIGRGCYVGNNALIRNYTSLEEGVTVGSNAEITESLIGPRSTVGRGSFIGCSVVGSDVVIGPGVVTMTVLLNGSEDVITEPIVSRGRRLFKMGSVISSRSVVGAYTVLSPKSFVRRGEQIKPLSHYYREI